jgi:hypothetical protein
MIQILLVGLGAGAAAALLFASVVSGSMAAVILFYLAPLPIMIAALGWSHLSGFVAAASATAALAAFSGLFIIAVGVIALGAWWLAYLALLARPTANGGGAALEWYPVGRLVLWAAVIGTLVIAAAIPNFGTDEASLHATLRKIYERIVGEPSVVDLLVIAVPPAAAVFTTLINLLNLWLAARIVKISGRLNRPWPDLAALSLPASTLGLLAAAMAGSFLPDLFGILSGAFAASLLLAFAIAGLAVLHFTTRGMRGRALALTSTYAAALVLGWPVLLLTLAGIADRIFGIRTRMVKRQIPPAPRI